MKCWKLPAWLCRAPYLTFTAMTSCGLRKIKQQGKKSSCPGWERLPRCRYIPETEWFILICVHGQQNSRGWAAQGGQAIGLLSRLHSSSVRLDLIPMREGVCVPFLTPESIYQGSGGRCPIVEAIAPCLSRFGFPPTPDWVDHYLRCVAYKGPGIYFALH